MIEVITYYYGNNGANYNRHCPHNHRSLVGASRCAKKRTHGIPQRGHKAVLVLLDYAPVEQWVAVQKATPDPRGRASTWRTVAVCFKPHDPRWRVIPGAPQPEPLTTETEELES